MERAQLKKWCIFIGGVAVLVLIWSIMTEFFDSFGYLSEHFYNPFLIFIPLSLFTVSALLFIIQLIAEHKTTVRILLTVSLAVLVIYCVTLYALISYSTLNPKNVEKYEKIKEMTVASDAIIPSEQFVADDDAAYDSDDYFALDNLFVYNGKHQYTHEDTRVTIETYCFEGLTKFRRNKLLKEMSGKYLYNSHSNDIEIKSEDIIKGTQNGMDYQYCFKETDIYTTSGMFQTKIRSESYFAIIIENGDDIIIISMNLHYNDFDFDARSTVENLISKIESIQEVRV